MKEDIQSLIYKLETELLRPEVRRSKARLDELLSNNFFEIGSSGNTYNKEDELEHLPVSSESKYEVADFKVMMLTEDIALANYSLKKTDLGTKIATYSLRSSLWRNESGTWRMLFHQGTPIRSSV